MKKNNLRAIITILVVVTVSIPGVTYAASDSTVSIIPLATNGIFAHPGVQSQSASQSASAASTGYCYLNATNVHLSTSSPNNVAADAVITCDSGQSIRISSLVVTLHKSGLVDHYLTGPTGGGVATFSSPLYYNSFKTLCSSSTSSTYWSTAHAIGVYADGTNTTADVTSPSFSLACGTTF